MSAIILTEIPRSGAAIVARMLYRCGVWCPPAEGYPARTDDQGGNRRLRETVVRPFMRGIGIDLLAVNGTPDESAIARAAEKIAETWRRQVKTILSLQGYRDGPWMYRSSDAVLLWPIWVKAFPEARWVFARREKAGIIKSCVDAAYLKEPNDPDFWERWFDRYERSLESLIASGVDVHQISPGRFISGKLDELERLVHCLNLPWDAAAIEDVLAPILWTKGIYELRGA